MSYYVVPLKGSHLSISHLRVEGRSLLYRLLRAEMRARLSKKKQPAPPPPPVGLRGSADKDSRTVETPVLW